MFRNRDNLLFRVLSLRLTALAILPACLFAVSGFSRSLGDDSVQEDEMAFSEAAMLLEDVEFLDGETRLRATLYRPESDTPLPALVLLGGSDRSARGPLKNRLARQLAHGGVAVLTYDSPGTGGSTGNASLQSRLDRAREALAAASFLRAQEGVDPARVGLCGGSEGAGVALLAAGLDAQIAFAIAVSGGFGLSMPELSRYRIETMGLDRGLSDDAVRKAETLADLLYTLLSGQDLVEWRLLRLRASRWNDESWGTFIGLVERCSQEMSPAEMKTTWDSLRTILRGWSREDWLDLALVERGNLDRLLAMNASTFFAIRERGPLATGGWTLSREEFDLLASVRCPVLAVWGENDDFLPPHRSATWLGTSLSKAGNPDVTVRILEAASHFLTTGGAADPFVPEYPRLLVEWLEPRLGRIESR